MGSIGGNFLQHFLKANSNSAANTPGRPDSLGWLDGSSKAQADGH
jgi:hypothetical protein